MQIKKFDSINVVPFIDIMLVLLVIVLTTATFVAKGYIPVDLAKSQTTTQVTQKDMITITIKENGEIFYQKEAIDKNQLDIRLSNIKKNTPLSINCDKNAKFEIFVEVIDTIKKHDLKNLHIITKKQ
jgi:biopolymer transport protein ExbD